MTQKLTRKLKNLGVSSSKALGSSTAARLSGIWGTRRSRTRRVMAMAKTASLKNTVRSISGPLSVQYSSDPLIRVSFWLANLYILDFQCPRSEEYPVHSIAEKEGFLRRVTKSLCHGERAGCSGSSASKLDLCSVEVCTCFGVGHYGAGKFPEGFLADTDSSTHCPYRRLCAAALGNRFRAWVGNLVGPLDAQVGNLLGRLGTHLLGAYLVTANPLIRSANPSVDLSPAYTTSPAPFHTTLGNSASIAGSVVG